MAGNPEKFLITGQKDITEALGLPWEEVQRLKKEQRLRVMEKHLPCYVPTYSENGLGTFGKMRSGSYGGKERQCPTA